MINLILSFLTAYFFGRNYKIGFWYSFLLCVFFGFLIGNVITVCSPVKSKPPVYERTTGEKFWAAMSVLGCIASIMVVFSVNNSIQHQESTTVYAFNPDSYTGLITGYQQLKWIAISFAIGFAVAFLYAIDGEAKPKEFVNLQE